MQSNKKLLPIIARYQNAATRLIRRHLPHCPALAPHILTIILEDIYDEEKLFEGPHLRPLIIQKINNACDLLRRLQRFQSLSTGTPLYHPLMHPSNAIS